MIDPDDTGEVHFQFDENGNYAADIYSMSTKEFSHREVIDKSFIEQWTKRYLEDNPGVKFYEKEDCLGVEELEAGGIYQILGKSTITPDDPDDYGFEPTPFQKRCKPFYDKISNEGTACVIINQNEFKKFLATSITRTCSNNSDSVKEHLLRLEASKYVLILANNKDDIRFLYGQKVYTVSKVSFQEINLMFLKLLRK